MLRLSARRRLGRVVQRVVKRIGRHRQRLAHLAHPALLALPQPPQGQAAGVVQPRAVVAVVALQGADGSP